MTILGSNPRARVDVNHPEAFGVCDLCGFMHNHKDLQKQFQWFGNELRWTGFLRCDECIDKPHEFNRPILIPPDPEPVMNARPPQWAQQEGTPPPGPPVPVQQTIEDD